MEHLLRFLAHAASGSQPTVGDSFRDAFCEACFERPLRQNWLPAHEDNFPLSDDFKEFFASSLPTSQGARRHILETSHAFPALRLLFGDKVFRSWMRELALTRDMKREMNEFIHTADKLQELAAAGQTLAEIEKMESATSSTKEPAEGGAPLVTPAGLFAKLSLHDVLRSVWDQPITSGNGKDTLAHVGELITAASAQQEPPAKIVASLQALAGTPHRMLLPLLLRSHERGETAVHPALIARLKLEAATVLASLGGHATALRLSTEIVEGPRDARAENRLTPRERVRAQVFQARCCLRAGEAERGGRLLRHLILAHPAEPVFLSEGFQALAVSHPEAARDLARAAMLGAMEVAPQTWLAFSELFIAGQAPAEATACLMRAARISGAAPEHPLCAANFALRKGETELWFELLRGQAEASGMPLVSFEPLQANRVFAFEGGGSADAPHDELVSVIMTAFNAAVTLDLAAQSVLSQRGCQVELVIVDDGSSDRTAGVIGRLAASDPRVTPVYGIRNNGTYVSKNHGISMARGAILAFHDSDDWMHPLKLHRQLAELKKGHACTTSQWLRMRADGQIMQRRGGAYAHLNPASTLFRRDLVEQIGPFDSVRVGADAEFLTRIRLRHGWNSVSQLPDCLALGLHHEASLTRSGIAAIDEHRYSPVRLAYAEAWIAWHLLRIERGEAVALLPESAWPFAAPAEIMP